ncbi:MAG: SRPBCC family protein [Gallionella sp.]
MPICILLLMLSFASTAAWPDDFHHGVQVEVSRKGDRYTLIASIDTSLTECAAYQYLTDYRGARDLPGVIKSSAYRVSANKVKVDRIADEHVLFFNVRLHSVMEYTEQPFDRIAFTQLSGDSKAFQGSWDIVPKQQGSTLRFKGLWEPDSLIPLFIIDHFAKSGLIEKFEAIARLAEKRKAELSGSCIKLVTQ